ncbi:MULTISPECIES: AraC family transcriptional regulator [unclassified Fusibacter]|uniref:AraC family transcriptional regulator n=1 Tax=unclassified Fusibacter TaxID=2624464 RepID=UPI0010138644|nr:MULTISPECIES: helix-turn-helix domain-containing protein [unclassified Fusibacter]MCK8058210.1 AraC family transcriptional regulator [Fusibacter sp. A2]NPE20793.1 AraC family transcriptional regulator [Fusibacter sp. A1]RXV62999.1 AraC family transcriptional regulator [Fusibacter sp. A1]
MSYYESMQLAIDYIEAHLKETVELKDIASVTGYSVPHVYRIFGAMVGYTVMDYVRKRRMSNALYDLVTTDKSVTEIAFENGYESHEVFTRTFKAAYGAPPRRMRKALIEPILFEKVHLLSKQTKGDETMKPQIICKDSITLVGIKKHITGPEQQKFEQLKATRDEMLTKSSAITHRINKEFYYAAYDYLVEDMDKDDDELTYTYYYCVEVPTETSEVPAGMVKKVLPQAKYAVFHYDVAENTLNGMKLESSVYDYIDGIWLPNSGFELTEESDFEVINRDKQTIDYYISVK